MAYNANQKATLNHLKSLAVKTKDAIDAAIQALPTEMFLDQAKTAFIPKFKYNSTTYAGSSNPNLEDKPVLVLAVKGIDHANNDAETVTYSFLDVSTLVDTYTAASGDSAKILTINGYTIAVNISSENDNAITVKADGLHVDISGKADKVSNATAGHVAVLDANGNLTDTGIVAVNILTTADVATDAEVEEMFAEVFGKA